MKKVFISQLMNRLSLEEIKKDRDEILNLITDKIGSDFTVIDNIVNQEPSEDVANRSVWALSESIGHLSKADLAVFGPGWEKGRGTVIENKVCKDYGIRTIEL